MKNNHLHAGFAALFLYAADVSAQAVCTASDVAGKYESTYKTIECTANGDRLDCCYDASCRYELDLLVSADGMRAVGRWDHLDGRSGTASFPINAQCALANGLWGNGDSQPSRGWSITSRLSGGTTSVSDSGTRCTANDLAGVYPSRYGDLVCRSTGSTLYCCYSSNCRYDLDLAIAGDGRTLTGRWDHKDGRSGNAEFQIGSGCTIGAGAWGEGTADPRTSWTVGTRTGDLADAGSCAFPEVCANQLPGDQFGPQQLPGDQFGQQQLPGDQFDPQQLPGDQFEPELLPGDQFEEQASESVDG